ncbi:MAG: DUF1015 domain-containing protein [Spirochaetaceae bacterium]|nr:DUF1015 domain-containing protein [Spirochaetaceae bacterium]
MATAANEVLPLRALCYDARRVGQIGDCLAPPYDVISPAMQDAYHARHPYNVVRLTLGKQHAGDTAADNRYTRAAATLGDWQARGVLRGVAQPAFWVYEQSFEAPAAGSRRVTGLIGRVRLHEYSAGAILPHEQVMGGVVEDRLRLTRACNLQTEYIWSIYREPDGVVDRLLEQAKAAAPMIDHGEHPPVEHPEDVRHRLWQLADRTGMAAISRTLCRQPIYIADGHHRYQTMLHYRDEMRRRHPDAGAHAPWEFILMFLVNTEHQELTILPIHRLLRGSPVGDPRALERSLAEHFAVRRYRHADGGRAVAERRWLQELAAARPDQRKVGVYLRGSDTFLAATLRDGAVAAGSGAGDASTRWLRLDVNVLNDLVLRRIFGVSEKELDGGERVSYTHSTGEALAAVDAGRADVGLLMNPTALDDVLAVAAAGERMPRKSTFFHPKPVSGLLFYPMAECAAGG